MSNQYYYTRINGKQGVDDEYYTQAKDVAKILSDFDLSSYSVYCPCDSEKSEWVKYLKGKCGKLTYTSDDWHNHLDLIDEADFIITNPPFKGWMEFFKAVKHKHCILIASSLSINNMLKYIDCSKLHLICCVNDFIRPDGTKKKVPCVAFYYEGD